MSTIRVVQMDILRGPLGIRRMHRRMNVQIREPCRGTKEVDEKINECDPSWFSHIKRMDIDRVNDYLQKQKGLDEARRVVHDWSEFLGLRLWEEPLTLINEIKVWFVKAI